MATTTIQIPVEMRERLRKLESYPDEPVWKILDRYLPKERVIPKA